MCAIPVCGGLSNCTTKVYTCPPLQRRLNVSTLMTLLLLALTSPHAIILPSPAFVAGVLGPEALSHSTSVGLVGVIQVCCTPLNCGSTTTIELFSTFVPRF